MSLQIWLPMTTPTIDTLSGSSVPKNMGMAGDLTWDVAFGKASGGKIDSCMTTGECWMSAEQTAQVLNNDEFSFCCWVLVTADDPTKLTTQSESLFGNSAMTIAGNTRKFSIFFYPTYNDLLLSWMNDEPGTSGSDFPQFMQPGAQKGVFPNNVWTHVAVTYKNPECNIYINGKKIKTATGVSNSASFAYKTLVIHTDPNGNRRLCDYRIYSNCLSAKEVADIAKGMIVHNRLSVPGASNLVVGSYDCSGLTIASGSQFTKLIDPDDGSTILSYNRAGSTANVWDRACSNKIYRSDVIDTGMTASVDIKCDSVEGVTNKILIALQSFDSSDTRVSYHEPAVSINASDGEWTRISISFTKDILNTIKVGSGSADDISYYLVSLQLVRDGSVHFKKFKVEKGLKSTPWIPNKNDAIYSALGFDSLYVDNTGYGFSVGVPTVNSNVEIYSNDTPKYTTSLYMNNMELSNTQAFDVSGMAYTYTISIWQKITVVADHTIFSLGNTSLKYTNNGIILTGDTSGDITICTVDKCNDTNWHHYALVGSDNTDTKPGLYIDGVKYEYDPPTSTCVKLTGYGTFSVPKSTNPMYVSDVRIYATNLNDKAIQELSSARLSIDKLGSVYAADVREMMLSASPKMKKGAILMSPYLSEFAPVEDMQIKTMDDGSAWALIFEHNCKGGEVLFSSYAEVTNTQTEDKYSRLYLLSTGLFKSASEGKHEFMLCYPDNTTQYNRWKQTNSPLSEYKGISDDTLTADGYEAVSIAWNGHHWGGLTLQSNTKALTSTCISGSVGSDKWFYAIGAYVKWKDGIPATQAITDSGSITGRVQLWVRIDNTVSPDKTSIYRNCITAKSFIET